MDSQENIMLQVQKSFQNCLAILMLENSENPLCEDPLRTLLYRTLTRRRYQKRKVEIIMDFYDHHAIELHDILDRKIPKMLRRKAKAGRSVQQYVDNKIPNTHAVDEVTKGFSQACKDLEIYFMEKRQQLALHKPLLIVNENIDIYKAEIKRKEELLQKFSEKLAMQWPNLPGRPQGSQATVTVTTSPNQKAATVSQPVASTSQAPLVYLEQSATSAGTVVEQNV